MEMKILFLTQSLGSGGAERRMVNIACLLKDKGYSPFFICLHNGDFYLSTLKERGIDVIWITDGFILSKFYKVSRIIKEGQYGTVFSLLETPNIINCLVAAFFKKTWRTVIGETSALNESNKIHGWKHIIRGYITTYVARYADSIVCNSFHATELWETMKPDYADKLETIYNPVILPSVSSKYIPLRNGRTNIVVAASYQYLKNPIACIKAVALMKSKHKIHIDWYGRKADAYQEACDLIRKEHLEEEISLHGEIKDITDKMNEADVIALFSKVEGLPNAICEGICLGKPILMSQISDHNILVDYNNGITFNPNDVNSISKALQDFCYKSDEELLKMGKVSKEKSAILFDADKICSQWMRILAK